MDFKKISCVVLSMFAYTGRTQIEPIRQDLDICKPDQNKKAPPCTIANLEQLNIKIIHAPTQNNIKTLISALNKSSTRVKREFLASIPDGQFNVMTSKDSSLIPVGKKQYSFMFIDIGIKYNFPKKIGILNDMMKKLPTRNRWILFSWIFEKAGDPTVKEAHIHENQGRFFRNFVSSDDKMAGTLIYGPDYLCRLETDIIYRIPNNQSHSSPPDSLTNRQIITLTNPYI